MTRERQALALGNMSFACRIADRYCRPGSSYRDDLRGEALLGLVEAAARYDPSRGPFLNFAAPRIHGAVRDGLRRMDHLGRTQRDEVKAGRALDPGMPLSLDAGDLVHVMASPAPDPEQQAISHERRRHLRRALRRLPDARAAVIIRMRLACRSIREIARRVGLRDTRVFQLQAQAVRELRRELAA